MERERDALEAQLDQIRILVTTDDVADRMDDGEDNERVQSLRRHSILKNLVLRNNK